MPMENSEDAKHSFEKCCKRSFYKGQSNFARALDTVLFNILRFFAFYFIFRQRIKTGSRCAFLAFIADAVLFLVLRIINRRRFEKHTEMLKKDTEKLLIKQKLILMEPEDYESAVKRLFKADCIILHSVEKTGSDKVCEAVREGIKRGKKALPIISLEPFSESAAETAEQLKEYEPKFILAENLAGIENAIHIKDEAIENAIIRKFGKQKRKRGRIDFSAAFEPDRAKKYFSAGFMLLLLSLVMSYGVYIRLFSAFCFTAAGFVFFKDEAERRKNSDSLKTK